MAKFLCKVDLRCVDGAVAFKAGNTYKEYKQLSEFLCLMSEEGLACAINVRGENGWFHAFELVKPEWPEPLYVGGARVAHIDNGLGASVSLDTGHYIDEYVREIHEWLGKWLEAHESRSG